MTIAQNNNVRSGLGSEGECDDSTSYEYGQSCKLRCLEGYEYGGKDGVDIECNENRDLSPNVADVKCTRTSGLFTARGECRYILGFPFFSYGVLIIFYLFVVVKTHICMSGDFSGVIVSRGSLSI